MTPRHRSTWVLAALLTLVFVSAGAETPRVASPFYGEAIFNFEQQKYFTALVQLEKEIKLGRLGDDGVAAETLRGSLYLSYGLHRQAQAIFERVLAQGAAAATRDLAWFYLAKIRYQRGYPAQAVEQLGKIAKPLPPPLQEERLTMLALAQMQLGDAAAAIETLRQADGTGIGYARFNLAVALLETGDEAAAAKLLQTLARQAKHDGESAALIDRVNLALAYRALEGERFSEAKEYFQRIELRGPYSNRALLGLGWAAFGAKEYGAANAAWGELSRRDSADADVYETYLALPYLAYQLNNHADAAAAYQRAITRYQDELAALDQALQAQDYATLLGAMIDTQSDDEIGWHWQHEALGGPLSKSYMRGLVSSHTFQESLKNYRDLHFIERNLDKWLTAIAAYGEIIDLKAEAYANLKPKTEQRLHDLAQSPHVEATQKLKQTIANVEQDEDALALSSRAEAEQLHRLRSIEYRLASGLAGLDDKLDQVKLVERAHVLLEKQALLEGQLKWQLMSDYKQRLWQVKKNLAALEKQNENAAAKIKDIEQAIAAMAQDFDGQRQRLVALEARLLSSREQVAALRNQHEAYLQGLIRDELLVLKARIEEYRSQAMLALAHIYDLNLKLSEPAE